MTKQTQNAQASKTNSNPAKTPAAAAPAGAPGLAWDAGQALASAGPSIDSQADLLARPGISAVQRQMLMRDMQRRHGNRHAQQVAQRVPVPGTGTNVPVSVPYSYSQTIPTSVGKYIKITGITLSVAGQLEDMPTANDAPVSAEVGGVRTNSGGQKGWALTGKVEAKQAADDFFSRKVASLSPSIKPYKKTSGGFTRTKDEASVNVGYEHGFDISPFVFANNQLTAAMEFNLLEMKKNNNGPAQFEFLSVSPKVELSGSYDNFPVQGLKLTAKGGVAVKFEPDWATLAIMALETPVGWVGAAAAGGALIIYFTLEDIDRQQRLMFRVRNNANAIAKAANTYGMVVAGKTPSPGGKHEQDAVAQANRDLDGLLKKQDMTRDIYLELIKIDGVEDEYFQKGYANYKTSALANYETKVENEIRAWHSDHWIQSFFAGRYASDDIAQARVIIATAEASGGEGFL